jgi:hypothetical protein
MADKIFEVTGFNDLLVALEHAPSIATPILEQAMHDAVNVVHDLVAEYPPATEANQQGRFHRVKGRKLKDGTVPLYVRPMGYYERGQGWWYPVMRRVTLGDKPLKSAGSQRATGFVRKFSAVQGYKLIRSSEVLGRSWTTAVTATPGSVQGEIGTKASYADAVQGDQQAAFHAARGWDTIDDDLAEAGPDIEAIFSAATDEVLKAIGFK